MMEWEEHLREMAQTADEHPEYKMMAWFTAREAVAEIERLRTWMIVLYPRGLRNCPLMRLR